jgi:iron complex outermembrane receptor protein
MNTPFKLSLISLAILAPAASAEETSLYQGNEIIVTATRFATPDVAAPYASEVHTRDMIEQSGAPDLFDYLSKHTSVNVLPSYGNPYTPKMDIRGYGIGDGYQNIVVTLDGRRLNNIDGVPQLTGAIPLADIERIEITKGSGSVMFGDGATAGSIQIYTRPHKGVSLQASTGNDGALDGTVSAGAASKHFSVSTTAAYASRDGHSAADKTGHRDESSNQTLRGTLEARPSDALKLHLDGASTRIDLRYPANLTLAQFNADPTQSAGKTYTHQQLESDLWRLGGEFELSSDLKLIASHSQEDKLSRYLPSNWTSHYDYLSDDLAVHYQGQALDVTAGVQVFDGTRISSDNHTSKKNTGWYVQGQYRLEQYTLSAGARTEKAEYAYSPSVGNRLQADHSLDAWDIGINRRFDDRLSVFANYNRAFQLPDIDRFFTSFDQNGTYIGPQFNGFISPAESRTLNLGMNLVTQANRLKLTVFRTSLDNEIYYFSTGPWSGANTNLDKSHKYGLELQNSHRFSTQLTTMLNYTYTRAIIDSENEGGGAYNGKDLPGVPRHGANLGIAYALSERSSLNLAHAWRSSAYAANDFANNFSQKQAPYQSTDMAYRYKLKNVEYFAAVDNIFTHKNGMWVSDNVIYPLNFTRNWRIGFKADF